MQFAMMERTKWNGVGIGRFASQGPWLDIAEMMRLTGLAAANNTRLFGHKSEMVRISDPPGFGNSERAFVNDPLLSGGLMR
jgi:hypothetical protein